MMNRSRSLAIVLAAAVLACSPALGACARGPKTVADAGPPHDLGERAVFAPTTTAPEGSAPGGSAPTTTTTAAGSAGAGGTNASTTTARPGDGGTTTSTTVPQKPLRGAVTDGPGDNGLEAPDYADLSTIVLEDTGTDLRATVTFATAVPRTLAEREVMGVGVDLFRTNERESDYQLFATGRADGWTAYLDTPDGFVKYPGTFTISGAALTFSVPWRSIGGHVGANVSTFADWSKAAVAVVAQTGQDSAPDQGTTPLA
jgi:hypothetical protein